MNALARVRHLAGAVQWGLLRRLVGPTTPEAPPPDPAAVRRVLVAAQMGIGNLVMFLPFLRALRAGYPRAHIAAIVHPACAELLCAQGLVDELLPEVPHGRAALVASAVRIARGRWDVLVVRFNGARYDVLVGGSLGRVPLRVGHVSSGRYVAATDWFFNRPVRMEARDHEVVRYHRLAEALALDVRDPAPALVVPTTAQVAADEWLAARDLRPASGGRALVALQPGTSPGQRWKRWPVEHWRALAAALEAAGHPVLVLGGADERALAEAVAACSGAHVAAGEGSLLFSAALLRRVGLLVGTDSALGHVAAAVGTRVLGIYGPTDRCRTRPWGEAHVLALPDPPCPGLAEPCLDTNGRLAPRCAAERCLRSIAPARVAAEAVRLLGDSPAAHDPLAVQTAS